ncbi:MAG: hypothetical protein ACTHM1_09640 [Solirubrobacteraceae bacterium]
MPEETPATSTEYDLARIAAAAEARNDGFLLDLANLADNDLSTSVGLLVGGVFMTGILASRKAMAEEVDAARTWLADQVRKTELPADKDWNTILSEFSTAASREYADFHEFVDKARRDAEPYIGDNGLDPDSVPVSVARRILNAEHRAFITLRDAQIVAPGQPGITRLPLIRVALGQIAAWWIVRLDSEGRGSFQFFETQSQ